jgi:hypothetical protein
MDSKKYSWDWVTTDRAISTGPCELVYAQAVSDGGKIQDTWLYNGTSTGGDKIMNFQKGVTGNIVLNPQVPLYCHRGIYVDIGSNTEGVLVIWRELPVRGEDPAESPEAEG